MGENTSFGRIDRIPKEHRGGHKTTTSTISSLAQEELTGAFTPEIEISSLLDQDDSTKLEEGGRGPIIPIRKAVYL